MLSYILGWISNNFYKFILFFDDLWHDAVDVFLNVKRWIVEQSSNAIRTAWSYATWAYEEAKRFVNIKYIELWDWIRYIQSRLENLISSSVSSLRNYVEGRFSWFMDWVRSIRTGIESWVRNLIKTTESFLTGVFNIAIEAVRKTFNPLLSYIPFLNLLLLLLDDKNRAKLLDFFNRMYASLSSFVKDPVGYVMSILWSKGVEFVCFLLGYGLGTTNRELPPLPNWSSGGGVYPYPLPPPIVIPEGELSKPLRVIYVSGYTFTPSHQAVDLGLARGETVYTIHDGTVEGAGWSQAGYGFNVTVRGNKLWSRYAHLESLAVQPGDHVKAGYVLGFGNSTGNSTGDHLHLEVKLNGLFIDPLGIIPL